jgi:hypothetical protein
MGKTIHVVSGTTGEYSDRSEWVVCAYTSEADARAHIVKATEWVRAWLSRTPHDYRAKSPFDDDLSLSYVGATYFYTSVELRDVFTTPEPLQ